MNPKPTKATNPNPVRHLDLQQNAQPAARTIMERRGLARPTLKRNQSSYTRAIESVEASDALNLQALRSSPLDTPTKELLKDDIKLVKQVQNESVPSTPSLELASLALTPNRYAAWECGFNFNQMPMTPSSIPSTRSEFLDAVRGELTTISVVKAGLSKYLNAINSGQHTVFPTTFLDKQNSATEITLGQLDRIKEHLDEIVDELGQIDEHGEEEIKAELVEVYGHAKPWIARTRAIMVHSHVFYKTNYALAADARKGPR